MEFLEIGNLFRDLTKFVSLSFCISRSEQISVGNPRGATTLKKINKELETRTQNLRDKLIPEGIIFSMYCIP
jgi:hypothetical protein